MALLTETHVPALEMRGIRCGELSALCVFKPSGVWGDLDAGMSDSERLSISTQLIQLTHCAIISRISAASYAKTLCPCSAPVFQAAFVTMEA